MSKALKLDKRGKLVESEASVQKRIVDWCEANGMFVFQNRSRSTGKLAAILTHDATGSPDLFIWGSTRSTHEGNTFSEPQFTPFHFVCEVKRKGGKPSQSQLDWAARFTALGHTYILAEDTDIVERTLRERGWL